MCCADCVCHVRIIWRAEWRQKDGMRRGRSNTAKSESIFHPPVAAFGTTLLWGEGEGEQPALISARVHKESLVLQVFKALKFEKAQKKKTIRGWDGWIWWPSKPRERLRDFGLCLLYLASRGGLMLLADVPHTVSDKNKNKNKQKNNTHKNRMLIPGETPQSSVPIWILLDA